MIRVLHFIIILSISTFTYANENETIKEASNLISQGKLDAAQRLLIELTKQYPSSPEPYNNLAAILVKRGDLRSAEKFLEKALQTQSGYRVSYDNLQSLRKNLALSSYRKSLDLRDSSPKVNIKLAKSISPKGEQIIIEKPVEVIKEVIIEKPVEVIREVFIDRPSDKVREVIVEKPVEVEVIREVVVEKPVEVIIEKPIKVEVIKEVEKIKEVIIEKPVEVEIIKEVIVEKPVEVIKEVIVERPVEVEVIREVIVEKPIEVIKEVIVEKPVEVIKEVIVEKPVEVIKEVIVEKPVEVIKEVIVEKPVEVIKEVIVEKPVEVEIIKEVIVEKPVEVKVIKEVEKTIEVAQECPSVPENQVACTNNANLPENSATFMLESWAKDWSDQNVNAYINHYVSDYSHKPEKSHSDWVELRKVRLKKPTFIKVKIKDLQVNNVNNDLAIVMLTQHYRSNTINDEIKKLLVLVNENGEWKIQKERALL